MISGQRRWGVENEFGWAQVAQLKQEHCGRAWLAERQGKVVRAVPVNHP